MLIYSGAAMLLWMEQGLTPNKDMFWTNSTMSRRLSMHSDIEAAVHEALHVTSSGSLPDHVPWILVDDLILDSEEIEMLYNHLRDPVDAVVRY
jgi:hypothetical protein